MKILFEKDAFVDLHFYYCLFTEKIASNLMLWRCCILLSKFTLKDFKVNVSFNVRDIKVGISFTPWINVGIRLSLIHLNCDNKHLTWHIAIFVCDNSLLINVCHVVWGLIIAGVSKGSATLWLVQMIYIKNSCLHLNAFCLFEVFVIWCAWLYILHSVRSGSVCKHRLQPFAAEGGYGDDIGDCCRFRIYGTYMASTMLYLACFEKGFDEYFVAERCYRFSLVHARWI